LKYYTPSLDFPLNAIRIWDAGVIWPDIEKEKGMWNLATLDAYVELAVSNNLEVIMTLGPTPGWASKKENPRYPYGRRDILTSPPDDIKDWENYLTVLGERYKGKIKYWEVWNEPDSLDFYSGSKKELAELTKSANKILKQIDPENKIISPSITAMPGSIWWLNSYLSLGAKDYVDIIGYHYYTLSWVYPESIGIHLKSIKSMMKWLKIADKPIWTTEGGTMYDKISDEQLISYIARMYIIQRYYGSDRFYLYALEYRENPKGLLNPGDTGLNPAGRAYKTLSGWLVGQKITSIKYYGFLCIANIEYPDGRNGLIAWTTAGKATYKIKKGFIVNKIESLDGKTISLPENRKIKVGLIPVLIN
jgi:hypothetical protein